MIYISIRESWKPILLVCFLYLFERAHWGCWKIFNVMVIILTCRQSAGPHFLDLVWLSSIPSSALFVAFGGSVILTKPTWLCHWDKLKWWCWNDDAIGTIQLQKNATCIEPRGGNQMSEENSADFFFFFSLRCQNYLNSRWDHSMNISFN